MVGDSALKIAAALVLLVLMVVAETAFRLVGASGAVMREHGISF